MATEVNNSEQAYEPGRFERSVAYREPKETGKTILYVGGGIVVIVLASYAGYKLIELFIPGPDDVTKHLREQLTWWLEEYEREWKDYTSDGVLSDEEKEILSYKEDQIESLNNEITLLKLADKWILFVFVGLVGAWFGKKFIQSRGWLQKQPPEGGKELTEDQVETVKTKNPPKPEYVPPEVDPKEIPDPPVPRPDFPPMYVTTAEAYALAARGLVHYSSYYHAYYAMPYYRPITVVRDRDVGESQPVVMVYPAEYSLLLLAGMILIIAGIAFLAPEMLPVLLLAV